MFVDEIKKVYVHKGDVAILDDIYNNEMTLAVMVENNDQYIAELENQVSLLKDALYELNTLGKSMEKVVMDAPYKFKDIKKENEHEV